MILFIILHSPRRRAKPRKNIVRNFAIPFMGHPNSGGFVSGIDAMGYREQKRFFIVTPSRTGSTLLAAILADAGAGFCLETPESWDPTVGGMEHEKIRIAVNHFRKAFEISEGKPNSLLKRGMWVIHQHYGKKHLKTILSMADYVKMIGLNLTVFPAYKLGFFPCIILNFREFEEYAESNFIMRGFSVMQIVDHYNRVIQNGILLLNIFGGCAIDYAELTALDRTEWASALSTVTGLSRQAVLDSRNKRVSGPPTVSSRRPVLDATAAQVWEEARAFSGRVIEPSPQALRAWNQRWKFRALDCDASA